MSRSEIILRVPVADARETARRWSELLEKHSLGNEFELSDGISTQGFSGAEVVEWAVPAVAALTPIVTAVIGYLIARANGEVEYSDGERTYKFRNLTPEKAKEFLALFREREGDGERG